LKKGGIAHGSIDLDFASVWENATQIINQMWPIFAIPLGVVFGFGILAKIIKEIRSAVGGG
jgi:hypothetical protein